MRTQGNLSCPWPPITRNPLCYPSLGLQMSRLLLCWHKLSMEGLLPHVGWRKVRGRRVAGRGPAYICRFAGWPSQLEPVVVGLGVVRATASGGEGWRYPTWVAATPQGKSQGPRPTPEHHQAGLVTFNVPADLGAPHKRFQWKSPSEEQVIQWFSKSPKQDKPQVRGEFMAILLCNMNINQICDWQCEPEYQLTVSLVTICAT